MPGACTSGSLRPRGVRRPRPLPSPVLPSGAFEILSLQATLTQVMGVKEGSASTDPRRSPALGHHAVIL